MIRPSLATSWKFSQKMCKMWSASGESLKIQNCYLTDPVETEQWVWIQLNSSFNLLFQKRKENSGIRAQRSTHALLLPNRCKVSPELIESNLFWARRQGVSEKEKRRKWKQRKYMIAQGNSELHTVARYAVDAGPSRFLGRWRPADCFCHALAPNV